MKKINYLYSLIMVTIVLSTGCVETVNNFTQLPPGIWRGEFILESENFLPEEGDEEVQLELADLNDKKLPVNFEVKYTEDGKMEVFFINGEERMQVDNVLYGRDRSLAKDSFRFEFVGFDSYISGYYEENAIQGEYVLKNKDNYKIPFKAKYGDDFRFTNLKNEPAADLSGKWACEFAPGTENAYKAVGEFRQNGNHLEGTFLTETGDYRFLEGTVQGNKAYLSAFDGTHIFLFTMKILEDDKLTGIFRSGHKFKTTWVGERNGDISLKSSSELTYQVGEAKPLTFDFPDVDGKTVSLEEFSAPAKLITLMGTWCPNCYDEVKFLQEVEAKYKEKVDIIAVAYERYRTDEENIEAIKRYKANMNVGFPILLGGGASKTLASEDFDMLNGIISFPTLMMLDKDNNIQYIHTGFNGPATSKYAAFKTEFYKKLEETINK